MSPNEEDSISEGNINLSGDLLAGKVTTDAPPPEVVSKIVDDHVNRGVNASLWKKMRALLKSWRHKKERKRK